MNKFLWDTLQMCTLYEELLTITHKWLKKLISNLQDIFHMIIIYFLIKTPMFQINLPNFIQAVIFIKMCFFTAELQTPCYLFKSVSYKRVGNFIKPHRSPPVPPGCRCMYQTHYQPTAKKNSYFLKCDWRYSLL